MGAFFVITSSSKPSYPQARSSGIQVLPAIHPKVSKITTFIREPTWVSPVQGMEQHVYSAEERRTFAAIPGALLQRRKEIETGINGYFAMFLKDSEVQRNLFIQMVERMKDRLKNETLEKQLIPAWSVGCRRLTPGINYLETLGAENVEVVYGEIDRITEEGCVGEDGKLHAIDVLICATGFNTTYRPRFPLIGQHGKSLADEWAQEAKSYLGMSAAGFPNYFVFIGPNSPVGNGPLLCAMGGSTIELNAVTCSQSYFFFIRGSS